MKIKHILTASMVAAATVMTSTAPALAAGANGNFLSSPSSVVKRINTEGTKLKATAKVQCDPNNTSHPQLEVGVFQQGKEAFGIAVPLCDNAVHTVVVTLYASGRFKPGSAVADFDLQGSDASGNQFFYRISRNVTIK